MLLNYFKTAWRTLWRNRSFSLLNTGGLTLGLTFSLLILLWVQGELNTDAWHANDSRLFQVYCREYYDHQVDGSYDTPPLLAEVLQRDIPAVEYALTLEENNRQVTLQAGDHLLKVDGSATRPDIFTMFSYPLVTGSRVTALRSPSSIAVSRATAVALFGSAEAATGQTVRFENKRDLTITAVFEDMGDNTSRRFGYLLNWEAFTEHRPWMKNWGISGPQTFVQLRKGANAALAAQQIQHVTDKYNQQDSTYRTEYGLQPFHDTYLHGSFTNGEISGGQIAYVRLFSIIAIFILLIACINFMNLTTARSAIRAREVGVRKAAGAQRGMLVVQFMCEALLLTAFAVGLSLLLAGLLLPAFNQITHKQLQLPLQHPRFWITLLMLTLVTGGIAGSYPALFLSSFHAARVLKGAVAGSGGSAVFRKSLVVFQFSLAALVITGTLAVLSQLRFIQNRNIGYDRYNLLYVPMEGRLNTNYLLFKQQALALPGIAAVSHVSDNPTDIDNQTSHIEWAGFNPAANNAFSITSAGYDFTRTMKLQLAAGRDFSPAFASDSTSFLLNEAAVKRMGFTQPLGQRITWGGGTGYVVGVVKDFNYESLHLPIEPLLIRFDEHYGNHILIRTLPGETARAMAGLEKLCKQMNPGFPFSYTFSDDAYLKLYQQEQLAGRLAGAFAFLAVFISCLGLLGLALFTAEQREKEISVRKILGADIASLFVLLSSEFMRLIVIALVIALPLAWLFSHQWLQQFAYRTTLSYPLFLFAGVLVTGIALLTISFQLLKAALTNPVKSLRRQNG